MRRDMKDMTDTSWLILFAGVLAIIVVIVLSIMATFGFGLFQRGTADFRGGTQAIEQTKGSGSYRIAAYDRFFDSCASIQSDEGTIKELLEERKSANKDRVDQINTTLTAVRSARREKIAEYNADARKTDTRGHFRSSDLPYNINAEEEITTCTA